MLLLHVDINICNKLGGYMSEKLQICFIAPELLGTYGDSGNGIVLCKRAQLHGFDAELIKCSFGDPLPSSADIYVLGGAEDTPKSVVVQYLKNCDNFSKVFDGSKPVLATCVSMQILGSSFENSAGETVSGLDVLDISTVSEKNRIVGELVSIPILPGLNDLMTGFENHASTTILGKDAKPLGIVVRGSGNGTLSSDTDFMCQHVEKVKKYLDADCASYKFDGAVSGNILATYMHGPCLARNPELADWLISKATGCSLQPLDFGNVNDFRADRLKAVGIE